MKSKIFISLMLIATLIVCGLAFVGCQKPATISINNDGAAVEIEVNAKGSLPYTLNGELLKNQSVQCNVELGKDVVKVIDNVEVQGLSTGYALVRVNLITNDQVDISLPIEVVVTNKTAIEAGKKTVTDFAIASGLEGDANAVEEFNKLKEFWTTTINNCVTEEEIDNALFQATKALTAFNEMLTSKKEAVEAVNAYALEASNVAFVNLDAAKVEAEIANKQDDFNAKKAEWLAEVNAAESKADVRIAFDEVAAKYNDFINRIVINIMLRDLDADIDATDEKFEEKLKQLKEMLDVDDDGISKRIEAIENTMKLVAELAAKTVPTYEYDGLYKVITLPAGMENVVVEFSTDDGATWAPISDGIKNVGLYNIKYTLDGVYAYASTRILKGDLPNPIWPVTEKAAYPIYTQLKDIVLVNGIAGEGSVNDPEGNIYGSRVLGWFRFLEEERYLEPDNYGAYSVELVPYLYDENGNVVMNADGTYAVDTNWNVCKQLIRVNTKEFYVTVLPVEGQWKNYDGTTATDIKYTFEVYEDAAKTISMTLNEKLENYIRTMLTGELVLEDVDGAPAVDAGHWDILQGTLTANAGALFTFEYKNVNAAGESIKYEIKPLQIVAINELKVEKVYDGTQNVPEANFPIDNYVVKGFDEDGNLIDVPFIGTNILTATITGAIYNDKNAGADKAISCDTAVITLKENGGVLKNYELSKDTEGNIIAEINITGTIFERPITRLTGRIADREYNGTDIAEYLTEVLAQRLVVVQDVNMTTGKLVENADKAITEYAEIMNDDIHITLLADGKYLGENNTGKDASPDDKKILFSNGVDSLGNTVTSWTLEGADKANYVYVGGLSDVDPDKAQKVTYLGKITKLAALGAVSIEDMEATKEYNGNAVVLESELKKVNGTYVATIKFNPEHASYSTILNDVINIELVRDGGVYWDGTNLHSEVGTWQIAFNDVVTFMELSGDANNYDWTGVVATGTGTITKKVLKFDLSAQARINPRMYDATTVAYTLPIGIEGGLMNFDKETGILSNVNFIDLFPGDNFNIRILKDSDGNYFNGNFEDKNVGADKQAWWAAGTWELVEIEGNPGKAANYTIENVELPALGTITAVRITTVKFNLNTRVYNGSDVVEYLELIPGTINDTRITVDPSQVIMEGMIPGDDLTIDILANGNYNDKNAAAEKEALFTNWEIKGNDACNYIFGATIAPGETTPTTTVKGVGKVAQKQITKIVVIGYSVDKIRDYTDRAQFNGLNEAILNGTATVDFEGIIAGDELSIEITAFGQYGRFVDGTWVAMKDALNAEDKAYLVKYSYKNAKGADRNNYFIDNTEVFAEGRIKEL